MPATRRPLLVVVATAAACLALALSGALASGALAVDGASASRCTNAGLPAARAYLPDCRGYEMVTPPYKGGSQVLLLLKALSTDGSHAIGTGYGGFAGAENNEQGKALFGAGIYEFLRTATGWLSESLEPPATQVSHSSYLAASADLSRTLWETIEGPAPPETEVLNASTRYALTVRTREDGSPARLQAVGPEDSPGETVDLQNFRFEGASKDLSHIVYGIEAKDAATWPGDPTTSGFSLYEYVGAGNSEPSLVGVRNKEALKGEPHVNEGAQLIGDCGAELGASGFSASKYNAISTDGKVVFFTANECAGGPLANGIYARVDGESTVAVSEPVHPLAQGAGPGPEECAATCEAETPRGAVFQGASQDGAKVFFTTAQSLLNGDEAGEGSGIDLYEAELLDGRLTRLVQVSHDPNGGESAEVQGVARISTSGERVYFVARGSLTGANRENRAPASGEDNLYVYDTLTGKLAFVATLSPGDERDWQEEDARPVQTTQDGRLLLLESQQQLTGAEDTSTVAQLFEYDAQAERIVRVSIGQQSQTGYVCASTNQMEAGYGCNGNTGNPAQAPVIPIANYSGKDTPTEAGSTLALTEDGRVFFMSRDALTPLALEESKNIYEYSAGNVYLIAPGEDPQLEFAAFQESFNEHDRLVSADASGTDLFFGAVGRLLGQDTDSQTDVYDARVQGGFANAPVAPGCEGGCRGAGSLAPALLSAPSEALPGEAPPPVAAVKPTVARTQKLAKALSTCRKKLKRRRRRCEADARRRYGAKALVKGSERRGK